MSIAMDIIGQVVFFCRRDLQTLLLNEITFGRYSKDAFTGKTLAVVRRFETHNLMNSGAWRRLNAQNVELTLNHG